MYRNIIWDVDGTLFDTYPAIAGAIRAGLNDLGRDAPLEWITALARRSLSECEAALAEHFRLDRRTLGEALDARLALIPIEANPPFPGARELCQHVCAIGGKNVIVTHRGRRTTLELLAAHGLANCFVGCITRDDGYPRKPDPAAFEAALAAYHLRRDETLTVGDRPIDILAGRAAGLFSCLYGDDADDVAADLTICRFDELRPYLIEVE